MGPQDHAVNQLIDDLGIASRIQRVDAVLCRSAADPLATLRACPERREWACPEQSELGRL
jgi:hypothetical protein